MKIVRYEGMLARTEYIYEDRREIVYDSDESLEIIYPDRSERYNSEKQLHYSAGPAIDYFNGSKEYYLFGQQMSQQEWEIFPREFIQLDGTRSWHDYHNLCPHRTDGEPAVIYHNGTKEWRQKGLLHRAEGPAYLNTNGHKKWYQHGKLHREDGPAIEWPCGKKEWYQHGKLHREDGPAIECASFYWFKGKEMSFDEFKQKIKEG